MTHAKRLLKIWVWALSLWIAVAVCAAQQKVSIQSSSPAPPSDGSSSVNTQLEVAPGTPLPAKGMVWILDQTENHPHLERIRKRCTRQSPPRRKCCPHPAPST